MVGMVKDASAHPDELPFKDPEGTSAVKPDLGNEDTLASASEPTLNAAPEAGVITTITSPEPNSQQDEPSAVQLFDYLQQGMETLRGLNLEGFKQIYPLFLFIFGAFLLGLGLTLSTNMLQAINELPLFGGVLHGLAELVGVVALVRFMRANLLLQHKRAELFTRIAQLKKELLG